jgi:hypothetical protein
MGEYPTPAHWSREAAYSPAASARCAQLRATQALRLPGFCAPRTLDELRRGSEAEPAALIWPAAPMSGCGSPSSCASCRRSSTSARSPN